MIETRIAVGKAAGPATLAEVKSLSALRWLGASAAFALFCCAGDDPNLGTTTETQGVGTSAGQTGAGGATGTSANAGGGGSSANASSAAGAGGAEPTANCIAICDVHAMVGCRGFDKGSCLEECRSTAEVAPWCLNATDALHACYASKGSNSFACDPEEPGDVDPKPGVCKTQVDAVRDCWFEGPSGGLPDLSGAIDTICKQQESLPCARAKCQSDYAALVSKGAMCAGAWAAMFHCVSQLEGNQWGCNGNTPKLLNDGGACSFQLALVFACDG
jgi:hypothetical protein